MNQKPTLCRNRLKDNIVNQNFNTINHKNASDRKTTLFKLSLIANMIHHQIAKSSARLGSTSMKSFLLATRIMIYPYVEKGN